MSKIVVEDRTRRYMPGELLDDPGAIAMCEGQGGVLMPVDPDWCGGGVTGFSVRPWGRGWLFNQGCGETGCSMVIRADSQRQFVYWAARLVCGRDVRGSLKLVSDPSGGDWNTGLNTEAVPPRIETLLRDDHGGLVVGGRCKLGLDAGVGFLGVALYAVAQDLRVLWTAVSQASTRQDILGGIG